MMSQVWSNSLIEMWNSISSRTATSLKRQTSLSSTDAVALGKASSSVSPSLIETMLSTTKQSNPQHRTNSNSLSTPPLRSFRRYATFAVTGKYCLKRWEENAVVIIDEFPFLIEEDDSLPSRLQRVWDMELQDTEMTLILVGSSISVMEDKVLSGSAPIRSPNSDN